MNNSSLRQSLRLSATLATVAPGFSAKVQSLIDTAGRKTPG